LISPSGEIKNLIPPSGGVKKNGHGGTYYKSVYYAFFLLNNIKEL